MVVIGNLLLLVGEIRIYAEYVIAVQEDLGFTWG